MNFFRAAGERLRPLGETTIKSYEAFQQVIAKMERATYERVERMSVFGDSEYCVEASAPCKRNFRWMSSSGTSIREDW
jgi:hypothetical protein